MLHIDLEMKYQPYDSTLNNPAIKLQGPTIDLH